MSASGPSGPLVVSVVEISVEKYRISISRGRFINDYLWPKIEVHVGTLYFPANSRLTTPTILPVNIQNIVNLPESVLTRDVACCICISSLL